MKKFIKTKAASLAETLICLGVLGIILTLLTPVLNGNMRSPGITAYFKDYSKVGVCRQWEKDAAGNYTGECNEKFGYKIYTTQNLKYEGMRIKADGTPDPTSEENCLAIRDVADLLRIQEGLETANCYILMDDINFEKTQVLNENGHKEWVPLEDAEKNCNNGTYRRCKPITKVAATQYNYENAWTGIDNFSGIFLGNGKILYKMNAPLFKTLKSSAVVQDFGIQDSNINGSGASSVGFLANNVTNDDYKLRIKNVYLKNSKITGASKIQESGGLIGKSEAKLELKYVYNDSPQEAAGGLVGQTENAITFDHCSVENVTNGSDTVNAGGFLGNADYNSVTIKSSSNYKGKVTGTNAGGFVGKGLGNIIIKNSWSNAEIKGTDSAGGFIGDAPATSGISVDVEKSYTMGKTNAYHSGGFVGHVQTLNLDHVYTAVVPSGTTNVGYILGYIAEHNGFTGTGILAYKSDDSLAYFGSCNGTPNTDDCYAPETKKITPISIKKSILQTYKFDDAAFKAEDFDKSTWLYGSVRPILKDNKEIVETDELNGLLQPCDNFKCAECTGTGGEGCTGGANNCSGGHCLPLCNTYKCAECTGTGGEDCEGGTNKCSGGHCLPLCNTYKCAECTGTGGEGCTANLGAPNCSGGKCIDCTQCPCPTGCDPSECNCPDCTQCPCPADCSAEQCNCPDCTQCPCPAGCSAEQCNCDEDECSLKCEGGVAFKVTLPDAISEAIYIKDDAVDVNGYLIPNKATGTTSTTTLGDKYSAIKISSKKQLQAIAKTINADMSDSNGIPYSKYNIVINQNINLCNKQWTPIGTEARPFYGAIYGNGHKICNLKVSGNYDNSGFLGYVDATNSRNRVSNFIQNLALENISVSGNQNVGGLAGKIVNGGQISNVYTKGSVSGTRIVGGLVGYYSGSDVGSIKPKISVSYSNASVKGESILGGLVGFTNGDIEESYATGAVTGTKLVGGLVGKASGHPVAKRKISNSFATGNVTGYTTVGGLAGFTNHDIANCYATGNVTAASTQGSSGPATSHVGGLVGIQGDLPEGILYPGDGNYDTANAYRSVITNSYATGTVTASNTSSGSNSVGGLVGCLVYGDIIKSYATGNLEVRYYASQVGGLVGQMLLQNFSTNNTIQQCYAKNIISTDKDQSSSVGGLVGSSSTRNTTGKNKITNSYSTGPMTYSQSMVTAQSTGGFIGSSGDNTKIENCYTARKLVCQYSTSHCGQFACALNTTTEVKNSMYLNSNICESTSSCLKAKNPAYGLSTEVSHVYNGDGKIFPVQEGEFNDTRVIHIQNSCDGQTYCFESGIWELKSGKDHPTLINNPEQ